MLSQQVGVFEQTRHVHFGRLLERQDPLRAEPDVRVRGASNFLDQSEEGAFSDEQLTGPLELLDLS